MSIYPEIHPVTIPVTGIAVDGVTMRRVPGMPGTRVGLVHRCTQWICGCITLSTILQTHDIKTEKIVRYFLSTICLQIIWSICLTIVDARALALQRSYVTRRRLLLIVVGDGVIWILVYVGACMTLGIGVFTIEHDYCLHRDCAIYLGASFTALIGCCTSMLASFALGLWLLWSSASGSSLAHLARLHM